MLSGLFAFISLMNGFTPVDPPQLVYSTYLPGPAADHSVVDRASIQYFTYNSTSACDTAPEYVTSRTVVAVFVGTSACNSSTSTAHFRTRMLSRPAQALHLLSG
jgi:hypothetical protein